MAGLVDYASSSEGEQATPPAKKRRISTAIRTNEELPPLPAAFLDQYSSTVRTSAQDDPSLHGGRKRITPHVQGNWPTHVYLECKFAVSVHVQLFLHNIIDIHGALFVVEALPKLIQARAPDCGRSRGT